MYAQWDEDEWETVHESRPCTACGGDFRKCNGRCNGFASLGSRRRDSEDVKRIKAERERKRQDAVLTEAATIQAQRGMGA